MQGHPADDDYHRSSASASQSLGRPWYIKLEGTRRGVSEVERVERVGNSSRKGVMKPPGPKKNTCNKEGKEKAKGEKGE
jgi:hypothetical protein